MAYLAVHVTDKIFAKLYPTLHQPTLFPYVETYCISLKTGRKFN